MTTKSLLWIIESIRIIYENIDEKKLLKGKIIASGEFTKQYTLVFNLSQLKPAYVTINLACVIFRFQINNRPKQDQGKRGKTVKKKHLKTFVLERVWLILTAAAWKDARIVVV